MHDFKDLLKEFGGNRSKYVVRFSPLDCFDKATTRDGMIGKFKSHREYVEFLFESEYGLKVIQHHHNYNDDGTVRKCGLIYTKTDSVIKDMIEVWGIEGVSVAARI